MLLGRLPLPLLLLLQHALAAQHNVSVDDTDPLVRYTGAWEASASHASALDFGGSHTFSSDANGRAELVFTGVAVYFLAPRWPYAVRTFVALDGGAPAMVDLTDPAAPPAPAGGPESAGWSVAWFAAGLKNERHSVVVSMGNYIVVDGFIYTTDDGISSSSSAASSTSSAASSTLPSSSSSATRAASSADASSIPARANRRVTIGLAAGLALAVILAAGLLLFAWLQRARHRRKSGQMPTLYIDDDASERSKWGSVRRRMHMFGGGGGARGSYTPVVELSESSNVGLVNAHALPPLTPNRRGHNVSATTSSGGSRLGYYDPWEGDVGAGAAYDPPLHSQAPSGSSTSSFLPAGAMSPATPGPYVDRPPPPPPPSNATAPSAYANPTLLSRTGTTTTAASGASRVVFAAPPGVDAGAGEEVRIRRERAGAGYEPPPYER